MMIDNVPLEMRQRPQWVVHKGKIPHDPKTGRCASVTDSKTWASFEAALSTLDDDGYDGLGFVFTESDPFVGIDFDHCLSNGQLEPWVQKWVLALNSYTELSPSGSGLHVICKGDLPRNCKTARAEMYNQAHYFTVTGRIHGMPRPITSSAEIGRLYHELRPPKERTTSSAHPGAPVTLTDDQLLDRARAAQNGASFQALWVGDLSAYDNDHSRADLALCNLLAYWTNGDIYRMDSLFRQSGLMRDKWDRVQSGSTYGRLQLEKAVAEMTAGYNPEEYRMQQAIQDFSPATGLVSINAAHLAAKNLEPIRFYVDALLPQGLAMLAAPPKYGKSWFVLDLCLAIARGETFLGRKTRRCGCLYLALEDSENRLQERMRILLGSNTAPSNLSFCLAAPDLSNGLIKQLDAHLSRQPDTEVIVIDTLQKIRGPVARNEGAYRYDYREMSQIKEFADRHKILVLLVHHLRKMGDDADQHNRISGTQGVLGALDTSLVLSRARRGDTETTLSITGRDIDSEELILKFDKASCRWSVTGTPEDARRNAAKQKYLNNPFVKVIRTLVFQGNGHWRGRMKEINRASMDILGDSLLEENNLRKGTEIIKRLRDELEYYDGITYERKSNGTNNGSGEYIFTASVWGESTPCSTMWINGRDDTQW